jgi:hypothetical protein
MTASNVKAPASVGDVQEFNSACRGAFGATDLRSEGVQTGSAGILP